MKHCYFNGTGTYQELDAQLQRLVPAMGEIPNADKNPALETYRRASNAYYDLHNNGGGNRDGEILIYAGLWEDAGCNYGGFHSGEIEDILGGYEWAEVAEKFEPRMDQIIWTLPRNS